jgi:SsrA-binding protein
MPTLAFNKRSGFDYQILEKYEAGLALKGFEVKSIKLGHISLKESFVTIKGSELYLTNAHITPYRQAGNIPHYDPTAPRKLLLRKSEIKSLIGKYRSKGLTLVPIRVYTKGRLVKLEFGLGKGKKEFDKREKIARRESDREIRRVLKNSR